LEVVVDVEVEEKLQEVEKRSLEYIRQVPASHAGYKVSELETLPLELHLMTARSL
jgi:hypothetical protein